MSLHQSIISDRVSIIGAGIVEVLVFQYWVLAGRRWAPIGPSLFVSRRSAAG